MVRIKPMKKGGEKGGGKEKFIAPRVAQEGNKGSPENTSAREGTRESPRKVPKVCHCVFSPPFCTDSFILHLFVLESQEG
jgi:hypothetical protein